MTDEKLNYLKNKISMELKNPVMQQGFEIICKRLSEIEKEIAELKAYKKVVQSESNEIIKDLVYCLDGIVEVSIPEENRFISVKKLKARAEKFLKECKE